MSWLAGTVELIGTWILGNKNRFGFILYACVGLCWIVFALFNIQERGGLLIICVPGLIINIRNYKLWKKQLTIEELEEKLIVISNNIPEIAEQYGDYFYRMAKEVHKLI